MPLNASNSVFLEENTLLATRLRAAEKPLRIPKVLRETAKSRLNYPLNNTVFLVFIAGFEGYPG